MIDYWLWGVVDCMRHEEEKIAGNTRDRGEKQGRSRVRKVGEGLTLSVPRHEFSGLTRRSYCGNLLWQSGPLFIKEVVG